MVPDFDVFRSHKYETEGVVLHVRKRLSMKGEIAQELVKHFAIVAAQEDGEDSSGRRAFKLQTPAEVVARACKIADQLVDEFEDRGWVVEIPAYEDIPLRKLSSEKV